VEKSEAKFQQTKSELKKVSEDLAASRNLREEIKETKNKSEINLSTVKKDLLQLEDMAFKELNDELKGIQASDQLLELDLPELEIRVADTGLRLEKMRESNRLNFSAESEFELLSKDHNFLHSQREDIIHSIQDLNDAIKKIDDESQESFVKAFEEIQKNFIKNFKILFEGGEAELTLTDPENMIETGLDIKAQPPGKKLQSLRLLSGGEKTLASLAFLFALFEYKPSPFCVFDEVDAALDEANIMRFSKFLHKLKEKTQFLIITHNFKTMEEADYIYGISMNEPGISTIYSMKMVGKDKLEPTEQI
jgi:chromosome segregation protein